MSKARDPRVWARLTVDFADSPKIASLSDAAFRALVEMILWSRRMNTDGVLPARLVETHWVTHWVTESVTQSVTQTETQSVTDPVAELLSNDPDCPSLRRDERGNYVIHDFLEHQESAADVKARLGRNRANGQRGGRPRKTQSVTESVTQSVTQSGTDSGTQTETQTESRDRDREELLRSSSLAPSADAPGTQTKTKGTRLPDDWEPSPALADWTRTNCPGIHPDELDRFRDYWHGVPGAKGRKTNWDTTWRNWCRRAQDDATKRGGYRNQSQIMHDVRQQAAAATAHQQAIQGNALALIEGKAS